MKKITEKMAMRWLVNNTLNGQTPLEEATKTIMEIANSRNEVVPWTPQILFDDIKRTEERIKQKNNELR